MCGHMYMCILCVYVVCWHMFVCGGVRVCMCGHVYVCIHCICVGMCVYVYTCMCLDISVYGAHVCMCGHMQRSEDNTVDLVFSYHLHMSLGIKLRSHTCAIGVLPL